MIIGFLIFLFIFFPGVSHDTDQQVDFKAYGIKVDNRSHGGTRCASSTCLCRVSPGRVPDPVTETYPADRRVSVYFSEGSSQVSSQQSDVIAFSSQQLSGMETREITIVGYTDGCGHRGLNNSLARERASAVSRQVRSEFPGKRVRIVVAGEGSRGHDPSSRRVDILFHTERSVTTQIEKIPADVYLIDSSGSMWEQWRRWTDVVNASFQPGSRIYLSTSMSCPGRVSLDRVSPGGRTEIWYSYWRVLDYMSPGETLLIISDFDSDIRLTSSEANIISQKVSSRQVIVKTINL